MKVSIQLERLFYVYIRKNPDLYKKVRNSYFDNNELSYIYNIEKDFFEKYNTVPSSQQLKQVLNEKLNIENKSEEDIDTYLSIVDTIYKIDLNEYDPQWLKKTVEAFIHWKTLDTSIFDAISYMKSATIDINNINDVVDSVKSIILERNNISFDFNNGLDFFNYEAHIQSKSDSFTTGFPYFDKCLGGGYKRKTLISLLGRMKIGKSLILYNLATELIKYGKNVAIISLEMSEKSVMKRVGSNLLNIPINDYDSMSNDKNYMKRRIGAFRKKYNTSLYGLGKLFVKEFPTSTAGVPDIENYIKKLEETEKIKLDLVVIDYINIMKNWRNPNSENTYLKIKTIAEDLRAMAARCDVTTLTATQINRKNMHSSDINVEDISESVGLVYTVDAFFGIIQDEQMRADGKYILKALALRDSEFINEKQHFIVNYNHMRIKEDTSVNSYNVDNIFKSQSKEDDE